MSHPSDDYESFSDICEDYVVTCYDFESKRKQREIRRTLYIGALFLQLLQRQDRNAVNEEVSNEVMRIALKRGKHRHFESLGNFAHEAPQRASDQTIKPTST